MHLWLIDDRYRVGERIRQRGHVSIYDGTDVETDTPVRIKRFAPELAQNMAFVEGWRSQLLSIQEIDIPVVQPVYAFGQAPEETLYQVEKPAAGVPLRRWLRDTDDPASVTATVKFMARIAKAIGEIHREGVSHGALSPDTIHVTEDEFGTTQPQLIDWDAGELYSVGVSSSRTARYQPPERHALPDAPHTPSTDVYALGYILYEALTQETPYPAGTTDIAVDEEIEPVPPSRYNPAIPESIERIILRALDTDPAMRPPHAGAFARSLRRAADEQPATEKIKVPPERTTVVTMPDMSDAPNAFWLGMASLMVVLIIAAAALTWQLAGSSEPEPAPVGTTPNLIGLPLDNADQLARANGLTVEVSGTIPVEDEAPDTVLLQQPNPGALIPDDRVLHVSVAGAPPTPVAITTVPNLFGLSPTVAERVLEENGLLLGDERLAHDQAVPSGLVFEQNPRSGISVGEGTAVDVIVSQGPPPSPTPAPGEN